jgi:pimeloyl-ACP methyl ester carboxylesterase
MVILPIFERVTRAVLVRRGVQSRFVETPVARLHLYDAPGTGDKPPVVLLHGIGSSASPFAPILHRLRRQSRRVLAPDAPGHGLSGDPVVPYDPERLLEALAHVLDRELDRPALLVGWSLGGATALRYARLRPERVAGLVLASPGGAPLGDPEELERFLRSFHLETTRDARAFFERLLHAVPWYAPLLAPDLVRMFGRPAVRALLANARPEHFFQPGELAALSMPIHVVWGRSDRVIPPACLEFFKQNLPSHTAFEEPEGVGHSPHIEDPRSFIAAIERMLAQIAERS